MAEAGYTLAQIQKQLQIQRVLDGTANYEERKAVAARLAQHTTYSRVLFALNKIADCDVRIYAYGWDANYNRSYFRIKSPMLPEELRERLCNAFGTSKITYAEGGEPLYTFANGMQFQITMSDDTQTNATIIVPHDFAPFEP